MIQSKQDYLYYLEQDRKALFRKKPKTINQKITSILTDDVWNYEKLLRKVEYYLNCKGRENQHYKYLAYRLCKAQIRTGIQIPPNCFNAGLSLSHSAPIFVHFCARIGINCRVHPCVVIASYPGTEKAPRIGNNVFIGAGAKIYGGITIADNIAIGANSVVNKSFIESNITIAGIPAKKMSNKGSEPLIGFFLNQANI